MNPVPATPGPVRGKLLFEPISFKEACRFIRLYHRHHGSPQGHVFSLALADGIQVRGVVIVGHPVARGSDDRMTLEVTRCCVLPETPNACSMLYSRAWKAARALGYDRLVTYTLPSEGGVSLRAAGWRTVGTTRGGQWDTPARRRAPVRDSREKTLWEAV